MAGNKADKAGEHAPVIHMYNPPGDARDPFLPPLGQEFDYDVAVIGGGQAGYAAAIKAAELGGKAVLFERGALGGSAKLLRSRGITFIDGEARLKESWVVACGGKDTTAASVILCGGTKPGRITAPDSEQVSMADTSCLGDLAEYIMTEGGRVIVDEYCQTNLQNVYACGDMTTAGNQHTAAQMGETAATNAMRQCRPST